MPPMPAPVPAAGPAPAAPEPAGVSPVLVALLRGILLAAAAAAVTAATAALSTADVGDLAPYVPVLIAALRVIEGAIDKARGQAPQRLGGSAPASASAYIDTTGR